MSELVGWTDYVCPFCYLAKVQLEREMPELAELIVWQPFELRPAPVPTLRPEDDYLPAVWRSSVYPMAESLGITIRLPTVSPQPRTELCFVGRTLALDEGIVDAWDRGMYEAFFVDDRDIGEAVVILDIGERTGLPAGRIEQALRDADRYARHEESLARARRAGVSSVPCFARNGSILWRGMPDDTFAVTMTSSSDRARQD